ncbi:MAG: argininosuccinate synthase [Deltaproteobacteria bacterium]|nr:argininosuccinate synthase [Deltaproteobacteria bacterium]
MARHHKRIVVAYSGGLDTSVIVRWLLENRADEVICYTADVGQGEDLSGVKAKALATGAKDAIVENVQLPFVRDCVFPMIQAHAVYQQHYLLGTSIARPIIGKRLVDIAREYDATAICHGATGKGNDQIRFELSAYAQNPAIDIVSPWREWDFEGRPDLVNYAEKHGIPTGVTAEKPYSMDANLLHVSYEGGILEDPWIAPNEDMFLMTSSVQDAPDQAEVIELDFEKGVPVALNGETLGPVEMLAALNKIAGKHGIGRVDIVEDRTIGLKSRGVYETPGGTVLHTALNAVESLCLDREQRRLLDDLAPRYAALIYDGLWYAPEREAMQAMVDYIHQDTTGTARIQLYKGGVQILGRKAHPSLYDQKLVSFDETGGFHQGDAAGFIKLQSLRLRLRKGKEQAGD